MANKPRIRFRGFTEDWEQRKLDDIVKIKTGGGTPKTTNPEYWSGDIPWIQSSDLVEGDIVHVNINKYINDRALKNSAAKLISRDSIALVTRVGVGKVAVINQDFTTSQDFLSLSNFDGNDIKFFAYQLYRLMQENAKILQGTSIKGITKTDLIEQSIVIPSSIQEQNLIANVLSKIDSIITLHQHKLKKLNLAKKALLQKLFPRNGSQFPVVRFKGFTDAWEQRKLGDLAEIVRGASPRPISDPKWFDNNSDVGWLRIADVTAQDGRIRYLEQKISELGQEKTRVVKIPHLLLSIAATVGKPVINYVPTGVHDGFLIFLNPKFNILYTFWWLEMFREKWNKYGQPGSQVNLNSDLVKNQVINIPNEKEQEKISSFLESLDKIITLHQRKLEKLQEVKKGLLQKMFV
ncbi:restriction endonuclease subunit S [uncultured Veillonella sp.]|uniref:restriction endonuclease subunit S n=1 Tax=uncultured Veillonella sp. TaxID=159268 RepID=UPI0026216B69|nr:restriction endonuclease subunit S [uncultured Veillonella sp.]